MHGGGVIVALRPASIQACTSRLDVLQAVRWFSRMATHKNFIPALFILLLWGAAAPVLAQSEPALTLDQAVLNVQRDTGGKVLSAESRKVGRREEYRIKVLTPDGHVKVMAVSSESGRNPASTKSNKNLPGKHAGRKEKH